MLHSKSIQCFTTDEAYRLLNNSSKDSVKRMLSKMVKRGLLMRVKEGLYYIIPFEADAETFMPDRHLLAQYLVGDADYYIGYYCALQIHNLTTQPHLKEQIVVSKQIKPSTLLVKGIPFQFIFHNTAHFFGGKKLWIDSFNKVLCSDLEKTLIDCLFKPQYAGGITEITKAIHKSKDKIDYAKLLQYAKQFNSQAVIKRLGFILELLNIRHPAIESLQKLRTNSFVLLEPSYPKEGKTVFRWAIRQNIDSDSILSPIFS
ncbi:MAG TPA: type IV toxin-antitoxin system AbiEi family antitoxin domain-containing protein [Candidatus Brocadiales bacterium]|nr:type IV toxin-antitoxin system AbiEi family antitoxin domain-containing protein [Candidatus Brocadiales bacterium]